MTNAIIHDNTSISIFSKMSSGKSYTNIESMVAMFNITSASTWEEVVERFKSSDITAFTLNDIIIIVNYITNKFSHDENMSKGIVLDIYNKASVDINKYNEQKDFYFSSMMDLMKKKKNTPSRAAREEIDKSIAVLTENYMHYYDICNGGGWEDPNIIFYLQSK